MSRIFVVDDDAGILDAVTALLESEGHVVTSSADPSLLQDLTSATLPDILLLDVLLSGVDGRDVCAQLRKKALTKDLPIIMFSAHPQVQKEDATRQCATRFLAKPFDITKLLDLVAELHPAGPL